MPGSFQPFLSALLRYLCGVLLLVTSNFNSLVLKTEYESCSFKILMRMKGAVYTVAQARSVAITMAIVANEMSERDAEDAFTAASTTSSSSSTSTLTSDATSLKVCASSLAAVGISLMLAC